MVMISTSRAAKTTIPTRDIQLFFFESIGILISNGKVIICF